MGRLEGLGRIPGAVRSEQRISDADLDIRDARRVLQPLRDPEREAVVRDGLVVAALLAPQPSAVVVHAKLVAGTLSGQREQERFTQPPFGLLARPGYCIAPGGVR